MIWLYIYIGTILFTLISAWVSANNLKSDIKKHFSEDELKYLKQNYTSERRYSSFALILVFILPVINVLVGFIFAFGYRGILEYQINEYRECLKNYNNQA